MLDWIFNHNEQDLSANVTYLSMHVEESVVEHPRLRICPESSKNPSVCVDLSQLYRNHEYRVIWVIWGWFQDMSWLHVMMVLLWKQQSGWNMMYLYFLTVRGDGEVKDSQVPLPQVCVGGVTIGRMIGTFDWAGWLRFKYMIITPEQFLQN